MPPSTVLAMPLIVFVLMVLWMAVRIPTLRRREAEAQEEAERLFADDPAGLAMWHQQRQTMRHVRRRAQQLNQQQQNSIGP